MAKLEHIGICAKDTVKLKDWYIKLFDLKIVYDNKKEMPTYFLLMEDGNMIEIYPSDSDTDSADNKAQGLRHLAFATDDIEKAYEGLKAENVAIIEDFKVHPNMVKTVFFKDPEGNILHFIQRPHPLY